MTQQPTKKSLLEVAKQAIEKTLSVQKEGLVVLPKTFLLKTEYLSSRAKEAHEALYKMYVEGFNKVSSLLDTVDRHAANGTDSLYRMYRVQETECLNAIKLHELYFRNISDVTSEIQLSSLPYMRLARDFGTFDNWQFDFRACCLASKDGWAMTMYEPLKKRYMNCFIDGNTSSVPMGAIPVIVVDMHEHAYFRDYLQEKQDYVNAIMRELQWSVIEGRMAVIEKSMTEVIYQIEPAVYNAMEKIDIREPANSLPIKKDQVVDGKPEKSPFDLPTYSPPGPGGVNFGGK